MQTWQATTSPEHMYRYTLRSTRLLLIWLAAWPIAYAVAEAVNLIFPPHAIHFDVGIAIVVIVSSCFSPAIISAKTTLAVTPEGILYRQATRTAWVRWQDIEVVRPWSGGYYGWLYGEGIVIRAEARPPGITRRRTFRRYFIPLEQFAPHWRESQLGDDIRRYAPWLLNGGPGQISQANRNPDGNDWR